MHLIGNRQGRRVVRWGRVVLNFLLFGGLAMAAASIVYLVVAKQWNPLILIAGPMVGIIATATSLVVSLRTPVDQLPLLAWHPKQ
jgi:hypothetical protein